MLGSEDLNEACGILWYYFHRISKIPSVGLVYKLFRARHRQEKESGYTMYLGSAGARRFFRIWLPLLRFVNERLMSRLRSRVKTIQAGGT